MFSHLIVTRELQTLSTGIMIRRVYDMDILFDKYNSKLSALLNQWIRDENEKYFPTKKYEKYLR